MAAIATLSCVPIPHFGLRTRVRRLVTAILVVALVMPAVAVTAGAADSPESPSASIVAPACGSEVTIQLANSSTTSASFEIRSGADLVTTAYLWGGARSSLQFTLTGTQTISVQRNGTTLASSTVSPKPACNPARFATPALVPDQFFATVNAPACGSDAPVVINNGLHGERWFEVWTNDRSHLEVLLEVAGNRVVTVNVATSSSARTVSVVWNNQQLATRSVTAAAPCPWTTTTTAKPTTTTTTTRVTSTTTAPTPTTGPPSSITYNDSQFTYTGTWTVWRDAVKYLGDDHASFAKGSTASLAFTGTQISVYGAKVPNHGVGQISIDGGAPTEVNWNTTGARVNNTLLWTSPVLPSGSHTIKLTVAGKFISPSISPAINLDRAVVHGASFVTSTSTSTPTSAPTATTAVPTTVPSGCAAADNLSGWGGCPVKVEQFDGDAVNTDSVTGWQVYDVTAGNYPRIAPNTKVYGGSAHLLGTYNQSTKKIAGSGLWHHHNQKYGRWEVRMKVDKGAGYSAVALLWPNSGNWPTDGEIGIYESPSANHDTTYSILHNGPNNDQRSVGVRLDMSQWHTYAIEWTQNSFKYYIDGVLKWTFTERHYIPSTSKMHVTLQLDPAPPTQCGPGYWFVCPNAQTPAVVDMQVDYVKIWKHSTSTT